MVMGRGREGCREVIQKRGEVWRVLMNAWIDGGSK